MTNKLLEGIRVYQYSKEGKQNVYHEKIYDLSDSLFYLQEYNGPKPGRFFADEELAERDKAIARAAFEAGDNYRYNFNAGREAQKLDDYLESEQFKKLIGGEG